MIPSLILQTSFGTVVAFRFPFSHRPLERKETGPGHLSERSVMSGGKPNTDPEPREQQQHDEASVFVIDLNGTAI